MLLNCQLSLVSIYFLSQRNLQDLNNQLINNSETPSKSSGRLERYKRRREKEYAEVIDDMKQQMENENIEVSDKIRCQADFIKREISDTDERMASIVLATEFNKSRVSLAF